MNMSSPFRRLPSVTVVIGILTLIAIRLICPFFGRLPMLTLAAGLLAYAIVWLLRRLQSSDREQGIAALFVIAFYTCSALTSVKPEAVTSAGIPSDHTGFYPALAESFLQLKLTLPVEPDPRLLAAANPYLPDRDYPFVWDAAFYNGRYYVYHGITPILTLFLPFRIVTQRSLPIQFGLLVFLAAGFVGSVCVLERARKACGFREPITTIRVLSVLLLGFASLCPLVLRRPSVYEVAIGSAYCFSMWGAYFLIPQFQRRGRAGALLASLCFGLSVGSRPTFGLTGGLLLLAFALQIRAQWKSERWASVYRSFPLLAPFALSLFVLGLYNKLRFDSWTEFGVRYQLDHLDMYNMKASVANMFRGAAYYLFSTPGYSTHFPGVRAGQPSQPFGLAPHAGLHEDVLGVFGAIPICCFIALAPFVAWYRKCRSLLAFTALLVGFAGTMILAVSNVGVSARYQLDFVPALLLASILVFYGLCDRKPLWLWGVAQFLWVPAACFSIAVGVLSSVANLQNDSLKKYHPSTYQMMRTLIWPEGKRFDDVGQP